MGYLMYYSAFILWFDHFLDSGAEICQIFRWFFGKFKNIKKTFWNYLTFSALTIVIKEIIAVHTHCDVLYINISTYWWIRTYVYKYVLVNTYLKDWKSISDNNLLNNNVNTVVEYQMHRLILSCFRGIPSEFLGNRWQY